MFTKIHEETNTVDEEPKVLKCYKSHPKALRKSASSRTWSMEERPKKYPNMTVEEIVDWLDVEKSPRWAPTTSATYCNVYAHDLLDMLGVYLPRIWWRKPEEAESHHEVVYAINVREMNANSLYEWMKTYGSEFGWDVSGKVAFDLADDEVGVILTRKDKGSGHVVVVFNGWATQAGTSNYKRMKIPAYNKYAVYAKCKISYGSASDDRKETLA